MTGIRKNACFGRRFFDSETPAGMDTFITAKRKWFSKANKKALDFFFDPR